MKEFLAIMRRGFYTICFSVLAIACFGFVIPMYFIFIESTGFKALLVTVLMLGLIVGGLLIIFMLGILTEDANYED